MDKNTSAREFIEKLMISQGLRGVTVHPTGNLHCQCPYHMPRKNVTAFGISYAKQDLGYPFSCRSCGASGNLSTLIMKLYGISREKANKRILKRIAMARITMESLEAGLHLTNDEQYVEELVQERTGILPPKALDQGPMRKYMIDRKRKAYGVLKVNFLIEDYGLYYCDSGRMHHRIIMPILDEDGNVVSYNDRTILPHEKRKSLHKPADNIIDIFNGLPQATGKRTGVIVEGAFDMFQVRCALKRQGKKYERRYGVLDNMGVGSSEGKAAVIIENFDELIVLFDNQVNDKGKNEGLSGSWKWWKLLKGVMPVKVATTNYKIGKDPGTCRRSEIIQALKAPGWEPPTLLQEMEDFMMEAGAKTVT